VQVATTCLFLASKVEETPKKLRDVVVETYKVQHSTVAPPESDQELWKLKEQVLICERELLRVLGFDLSVEHAYRPLLAYVKSISGPRDLAQIAWNFINDSLRTTVCLQYAPRCLAAAAAWMASSYLEAKQRPFALPNHPSGTSGKWYVAFDVTEATVRNIVEQIQRMYDDNKAGGGGILLANSGAVERMRMQSLPSSAPSLVATCNLVHGVMRHEGNFQRGAGNGGGGGAHMTDVTSGMDRSDAVSRSREDSAPIKRNAEEGELEEGRMPLVPTSKRPRDECLG